ncbi:kinase-interacting family protein-like [Bidens hawaiensis]|uniref:kinase-interacting family protein-like n=1 Tax=Bidens hawaiensis TaxID=980011 RepID=UPI00404998E9
MALTWHKRMCIFNPFTIDALSFRKVIGPVDVMLPVTYSGCSSTDDGITSFSPSSEPTRRSKSRFTSKPSWLLLTISDMEDKIQSVNGEYKPDTFGERADFYYRKRPELLALLQDLYNRYLYLADRYTRALSKQQTQRHVREQEQQCHTSSSDHVESSLSCQSPIQSQEVDTAMFVISELVMKFVDYDIVMDELQNLNMIQEESKKKIEIQKSLLEVLESERVVLSNENSRLASESLFMKRKAGELARCVLQEQTEDEHVLTLSRKIDDLQGKISELKKKNKEYYDKLMKQEMQVNKNERKKNNMRSLIMKNNGVSDESSDSNISWSGEDETGCSVSSTSNSSTCTSLVQVMKGGKKKQLTRGSDGKKRYGLWDRVKKFDLFTCGHHLDGTC